MSGFQTAGANTVRLPVNPPTVLGTWWQAYKGAIDKASTKNMKVLLAYWEGASSRNGLIDNTTTFWQMWDAIIAAYRSNPLIYFEVFNEPHGYNSTDLLTLYNQFVTRYLVCLKTGLCWTVPATPQE
ncbi:cellulase family glycosylhydrolase [Chitinophaga pinensis]|uniref:Glycoside hydrolase family 5 protein n=1 Tax=Chitinophaga pinensis TaxID=79329 RepID=A0A5C6LLH7_9BACT|nr:cellulase family glycosylhydrolase [Chitinophaga pinensis]TWV92759.1 glycoside hydrolase family 5 protein [Chitinophaga pinensis]